MTYTHSVMKKHHGKRHGKRHGRVTESIRTCVHSVVQHLHCDIVTMTSGKAKRQRWYIARINADPQK